MANVAVLIRAKILDPAPVATTVVANDAPETRELCHGVAMIAPVVFEERSQYSRIIMNRVGRESEIIRYQRVIIVLNLI